MITRVSSHAGFTAAELLISLFIGAAFIGGAYQLYGIAIGDSGVSRAQAIASNLAYTTLRSTSSQLAASNGTPCSPSTPAPTNPTNSTLPGTVTISTTITCPYAASEPSSALNKVTVTITYGQGTPQKKVTHAVYVSS